MWKIAVCTAKVVNSEFCHYKFGALIGILSDGRNKIKWKDYFPLLLKAQIPATPLECSVM